MDCNISRWNEIFGELIHTFITSDYINNKDTRLHVLFMPPGKVTIPGYHQFVHMTAPPPTLQVQDPNVYLYSVH